MMFDTRKDDRRRDEELTTAQLAQADEPAGSSRRFERDVTELNPESGELRSVNTTTVDRASVPKETRDPLGSETDLLDGEYVGNPDDRSFSADRGKESNAYSSRASAATADAYNVGAYGSVANSDAFNQGAIAGSFGRQDRQNGFDRNTATDVSRRDANAAADEGQTALLSADETQSLRARWDAIQVGFVDEPRTAVQQADSLVANAMKRLAEVFADERARLEGQWDRGGDVSTEELRVALQRYRSFFGRLLSV